MVKNIAPCTCPFSRTASPALTTCHNLEPWPFCPCSQSAHDFKVEIVWGVSQPTTPPTAKVCSPENISRRGSCPETRGQALTAPCPPVSVTYYHKEWWVGGRLIGSRQQALGEVGRYSEGLRGGGEDGTHRVSHPSRGLQAVTVSSCPPHDCGDVF